MCFMRFIMAVKRCRAVCLVRTRDVKSPPLLFHCTYSDSGARGMFIFTMYSNRSDFATLHIFLGNSLFFYLTKKKEGNFIILDLHSRRLFDADVYHIISTKYISTTCFRRNSSSSSLPGWTYYKGQTRVLSRPFISLVFLFG